VVIAVGAQRRQTGFSRKPKRVLRHGFLDDDGDNHRRVAECAEFRGFVRNDFFDPAAGKFKTDCGKHHSDDDGGNEFRAPVSERMFGVGGFFGNFQPDKQNDGGKAVGKRVPRIGDNRQRSRGDSDEKFESGEHDVAPNGDVTFAFGKAHVAAFCRAFP